jgi:hypothetical protein
VACYPKVLAFKVLVEQECVLFHASEHFGNATEEAATHASGSLNVHNELVCKLSNVTDQLKIGGGFGHLWQDCEVAISLEILLSGVTSVLDQVFSVKVPEIGESDVFVVGFNDLHIDQFLSDALKLSRHSSELGAYRMQLTVNDILVDIAI